ncbi:response regulator transcription factor [Bacillus sp. Marseille-P3661]|uniref:response regulator transcription factor n=1 Tax=Bacillus sp. Marseille-P3661 TaxID=1936234 RepID=UPI0015E15F41|nr:response regulator [Bacillus sp. Marseille-P3661]
MKILIAEDEIRLSNLLRLYLERESYIVDIVANGNDGLEKSLQENYDLIILDVFMPGKDGFTVLEEIRKVKNTPVILLTAQSGESDHKRGFSLGANAFISKPFSPSTVVTEVNQILNNRQESN